MNIIRWPESQTGSGLRIQDNGWGATVEATGYESVALPAPIK